MRLLIMGAVELEIVFNTDGTVAAARVTKSLDREHGLDREALIAARYWLFEPARVNGQPIVSKVSLQLEFRLN